MSKVRAVFMGTPEFAVTCLKGMLNDDHFEVVGVITQPDRPSGRKLQLQASPVKAFAQSQNLKVISPETVSNELIKQEVQRWSAEIAVVVAFGQLLKEDFMSLFPLGCVNVHASLLPRWRGAAPIQRSIEAGDLETGVSLQKIVKKLDAGDVLGERKILISENMDAIELHNKLAELGESLLHIELMDYVRGNLHGVPQDESKVTYAKKIDKSESEIQWSLGAAQIHNKIRALKLGPGTFTFLGNLKIKIHKTEIAQIKEKGRPGEIIHVESDSFFVATSNGVLKVLEVQPESKKLMSAADFIRGYELKINDYLGKS